MRLLLLMCGVALVACTKKDTTKTDVAPVKHDAAPADAAAAKPAVAPQVRAKEILDRQLAALNKAEQGDPTLLATFDPDAVLLVPDPRLVSEPQRGFRDAILQRAPSATVKEIAFDDVVAGGNANAVWLTATLKVVQGEDTYAIRVTELATVDSGWKVVAAAFTSGGDPSAGRNPDAQLGHSTDAGNLTGMLLDPPLLASGLAPDATVFTFNERLQGAAAKAAVAKLPAMNADTKPREVHGKGWGYTIAQLSYDQAGRKFPIRISALVIAVPTPNSTTDWTVVAAHYTD